MLAVVGDQYALVGEVGAIEDDLPVNFTSRRWLRDGDIPAPGDPGPERPAGAAAVLALGALAQQPTGERVDIGTTRDIGTLLGC